MSAMILSRKIEWRKTMTPDQEKLVDVSVTVPESLAEFLKLAMESQRFMVVISYVNPLQFGRLEHARTILNFPIGDILPSLEKHKEQFTLTVLKPRMQGITATMVDDADNEAAVQEKQAERPQSGLKIIDIKGAQSLQKVQEQLKRGKQPKREDEAQIDDEGWE
jgi:hypothetical protein